MHKHEQSYREKFLVNGQTAKERLEEMFKEEQLYPNAKESAFIWVLVMDKDGQGYGSFKRITRKQLEGRDYIVQWCDYRPGILILDSVFEPRGSKWSNPL
jgi:hypothetical protein